MIVKRLRRRSSDKAHRVYGGVDPGLRRGLARRRSEAGDCPGSMRGRATFIALASVALVAAPVGSAAARRGGGPRGRVNGKPTLPTGCTHGGAPFVTHGPRGRKRIAIGFDDGPSDYTPQVLRVLRRFDSHATFFEIGQETAGRVSTMRKILAQGNEIGNHSLHHEMRSLLGSRCARPTA